MLQAQQQCVVAEEQSVVARQQASRIKTDCKQQLASLRSKLQDTYERLQSTRKATAMAALAQTVHRKSEESQHAAIAAKFTEKEAAMQKRLDQKDLVFQQLQQQLQQKDLEIKEKVRTSALAESELVVKCIKSECHMLQLRTKEQRKERVRSIQNASDERIKRSERQCERKLEGCKHICELQLQEAKCSAAAQVTAAEKVFEHRLTLLNKESASQAAVKTEHQDECGAVSGTGHRQQVHFSTLSFLRS